MRLRLSVPSASLLLALAGCPEAPPDPVTVCDVTDSDDTAALAAWLARTHKTCSLEAVFPHRGARVTSAEVRGDASGWDRTSVLAGADVNGVRAFSDDRRSFAAFRDFVPLGDDVRRIQDIEPDAECAPDAPAFAARVELVDGTCTVSLGGDVVFAAPLFDEMRVSIASWPGLEQERWPAATPPNNLPALAVGFEYIDLPAMPSLEAFEDDRRRFAMLADWLGTTPQVIGDHVRFELELGDELLVPVGSGGPPIIWGDRIPTIVTRDEAIARRTSPLHVVWHHSGPIDEPTSRSSTIEITDQAVTYTGGHPRDTARAASEAAQCLVTVIERDLTAIVSRWDYTPPVHSAFTTCGRRTTDLAAAAAADERALALVLELASDRRRARHGYSTETGTSYGIGHRYLHAVIGAALVDDAALLATREPSVILDHAARSWSVLRDRVPAPLARRVATAVSARAENHFEQVAWELPALPALTDADADAIARDIEAAADPLAEAFVADLAWRITREPVPAR